ncbi:MAG: caspase family protein [Lewinellaceae bacterium]|nr:caspase family protein [Lewinellaceae bacterium]
MNNKPRLQALLVGINQYQPPVPPLAGCLHDVDQMAAYLQDNAADFQLSLQTLTNEAATKAGIIQGFREHLSKAGPGDTALFYYSGHGTQEEADPALWRFETDGKLEALVCYDGILETENGTSFNLLADKELRYLIYQLSQKGPKIVTIFDCCHAGGNTRNDYVGEQLQGIRQRRYHPARLTRACPPRPWEQFLFAKEASPERLKTLPLPEVIPVGAHIQLAACQGSQSAYEKNGSGAFTTGMIQLLKDTGGQITYYGLAHRLRFLLKETFDQSPQFYAAGAEEGELFQGFLGKEVQGPALNGNVIYNEKLGWILDLGAMHGLNETAREITIKALDGPSIKAKVGVIHSNHTILNFDQDSFRQLKAGAVYKADIEGGLLSQHLQIALEGEEEALEPLKTALENQQAFGLAKPGTAADYTLRFKNGEYLITPPGAPGQPFTRAIKGPGEDATRLVAAYLRHIARWEFIRTLYNPDVYLFNGHPVSMEFFRVQADGSLKPIAIEGEEVKTEYERLNGEWSGRLRLKLTNQYDRRLYVSLLFLSLNFQVYPNMLGEAVIQMEPGQEAWAFEGNDIELDFPRQVADFKLPYSPAYFKLIASTQEFDVSRFEQPPLPAPTDADGNDMRGIKLPNAFQFVGDDWATRLVTLLVRNPEYRVG